MQLNNKIKLIYNPYSGSKNFKNNLDNCINIFQKAGYEVHVIRIDRGQDINNIFADFMYSYSMVVIAGGDGTLNLVVNAMMRNNVKLPLGIIPAGTANDFATQLNMPLSTTKAAESIVKGYSIKTDLGLVNDKYFINVCAMGFFSNISHVIDSDFKNAFGKLAYYIKGLEQLPNFKPIPVKIKNSKEMLKTNIYLCIVLNSCGAAGFERLSPKAMINDGLLDFIAFKTMNIISMALLFIKITRIEHLNDPNIIFFRDNYIEVEFLGDMDDNYLYKTDIDGETGPSMPVLITTVCNALDILVPGG